ncbi:MAG: ABC transporter permease [Lachnospiraceae bacterium]|nr:ABC transporter permease [Lachnospiraceae bacterium]MDY5741829.1 ABC transporter permease [Lachnospiraceae bacterium]
MKAKKIVRSTEFYVGVILVLFCVAVQIKSGQFFTGNNLVDNIRAFSIPAMFCIGEMFVLISGGTDVSFPGIASLSMYVVCSQLDGKVTNPLVYFLLAMLIGLTIGAVNGLIIGRFKFPPLIVTLGTSSICFGVMQGVFQSREYPLPESLYRVGQTKVFSVTNASNGLSSDMPVAVVMMLIMLLLGWFILNKTMLGRGIYAIGGDAKAAHRSGFNVFGITMFIYCFSGCVAGLIGVLRATMLLAVHPNNLEGMEMTVIAACVLGGVRITGGKGSILGMILGMALLTIIDNSLILLGISTQWQRVFTGIIIIIGTAASAIQARRNEKQLAIKLAES